MIRRYPITALVALQYIPLVILPALTTDAESTGRSFVLSIVTIALVTTCLIESALAPLTDVGGTDGEIDPRPAIGITVVGFIATVLTRVLGASTYETQIGQSTASHLATFFTPLQVWALIGPALLLYRWGRSGQPRRSLLVGVVGACVALQMLIALLMTGTTVGALHYTLAISFAAAVTGIIRTRTLAIGIVAFMLIWPLVFSVRQDVRIQAGGTTVATSTSKAADRLKLNRELAQAEWLVIPRDERPALASVLRFGLLPRFLDPGRGTLGSGFLINQLRGGESDSAYSLTTLGMAYVFAGQAGLIAYLIILTLLVAFLIRRRGPWPFVMLVLLVEAALWIESPYPDLVATFLQNVVSGLAAFIVMRMFWGRAKVPEMGLSLPLPGSPDRSTIVVPDRAPRA